MKPALAGGLALALGCARVLAAEAVGASDDPPAVVLERCNVVAMVDERILESHAIVVAGDEIVAVESMRTATVPAGARRIDCDGRYVVPGLTDAHVHIGHESELLSYLRYGVTSVFNLGGDYVDLFSGERLDILALREAVAEGALPGPSIFSAGQSLDGDPPTGPFQQALDSVAAAEAAVRAQLDAGYDFIKVYDSLSPALHAAIMAASGGTAVFGHVPEAVGVTGTLEAGQHVIAHAEEFYAEFEGDGRDPRAAVGGVAAAVRASGTYVTPNLAFVRRLVLQLEDLDAQLARPDVRYLAPRVRVWWEPRYNYYTNREDAPQFLARTRRRLLWMVPFVRELHRRGVPLLTGSDASVPAALPGLALHDELADLVAAGLSPYEALQTATVNVEKFAVRFLADKGNFGTIRAGNRADLVLVTGNPLAAMDHLRGIAGVMVRGRWYEPATLVELLEEATAELRD